MQPSRRAIVLFAAGIALAALPALVSARLWPAWAIFWTLGLLLIGIDALLAPRAKDLRHVLEAPPTLFVGAPARAVLTLHAPTRSALPAEVQLDLSDTLAPQPRAHAELGPAGAAVDIPLVPIRRGKAELEAAWVRYPGPLGLLVRSVRLALDHAIPAVPDVGGVRAAALTFSNREHQDGIKIEQYAGDGSEFDSLREFSVGSDARAIDWKASARHAKLLTRQFRAERNHSIVIALDTGRLMAEPLGGLPRLDHAIHAGLLLAYASARAGDRVSLFAFDERPRCFLAPRSGMAAFRALAQVTADLDYADAEPNYTLGLTNLSARLQRRSLVVVLTDFVDSVTAELMVDNLHRLAKRHLVVFVALRDPLLAELALAEPLGTPDLNRAVVAESMLRERELVLRRLRRRGIFCVDAPPNRVGSDLLNRYLEIKRRELI